MSFFYPHHHPQQPSGYSPSFFDLLDRQESPFYTPAEPYNSYPRRPYSHSQYPHPHPHRQSPTGLFRPEDLAYNEPYPSPNIHPLHQLRQRKLDRDALENCPQSLGYHNSHPLHQLRQHKLDRDALETRSNCGLNPSRRVSLRENPPNYEDSLRTERARRLAEAKMRQLGVGQPKRAEEEEMKVELTLPDGRECIVPISWARKMQRKYPGILTNGMIRPHRTPSPQLQDQVLGSDSDQGSDFYVLDPTQDPSVPVLGSSSLSSPPPAGRRSSPTVRAQPPPPPPPPKHSAEELDAAARLIQQQFRAHRSLKHLAELESTFDKLKSEFVYPALLDLKFVDSPDQSASNATPSSTKLTFGHPVNRSVQAFEEGLTQLQIKADAILSRGNPKIKGWRKQLIKAVEAQLDQLERFKSQAWTTQHLAHLESLNNNQNNVQSCEDVEMNDEIVNTDVESVAASDHINIDSDAIATPLTNGEVADAAKRSEHEDHLIIPAPEVSNKSMETLVIPASSTRAPSPTDDDTTASIAQDDPPVVSSCSILTPSVTNDGDLICPAPAASISSDDILVSPV
ncbi:hypothetical protein PGT21_020317 [Puccinia graminis f. sp. tritici]|uniref:BAG domain-containing protein n=1 Tax=Puccinia graminis f. sp. tritici TaxID=56615 RepID=A0A5B0Q622_PUCGR|nr:hypothetical protein PGT21_020317 [Puccinia graminis f. sp. tritici]